MIYLLDTDLPASAAALDDRSLEQQIRDIAQVLCNIHDWHQTKGNIPLGAKLGVRYIDSWACWARECKANYLWLVEYGLACSNERYHRFAIWRQGYAEGVEVDRYEYKELKSEFVIEWAKDNVPDLPVNDCHLCRFLRQVCQCSIVAVIVPNKYMADFSYLPYLPNKTRSEWMLVGAVTSYRNYFQAKLKQRINKLIKSYGEFAGMLPIFASQVVNDDGTDSDLIRWTNRTRPEWLKV